MDAGGFYTHSAPATPIITTPSIGPANRSRSLPQPRRCNHFSIYKERTLFGDLTWHISARFDLSTRIRYAHSDQGSGSFGAWNSPVSYDFSRSSESATTWMASPAYQTPQTMLYARVATGSQPSATGTAGNTVNRQGRDRRQLRIGLEAKFLDQRALIDLASFSISTGRMFRSAFQTASGASSRMPGRRRPKAPSSPVPTHRCRGCDLRITRLTRNASSSAWPPPPIMS